LDADEKLEVAIAQVAADEDLVTLEAACGSAELPYASRAGQPRPPLVTGAARRHVEQARALAIGRGHELDEGAVLAVWVGLLVDLARDTAATARLVETRRGEERIGAIRALERAGLDVRLQGGRGLPGRLLGVAEAREGFLPEVGRVGGGREVLGVRRCRRGRITLPRERVAAVEPGEGPVGGVRTVGRQR